MDDKVKNDRCSVCGGTITLGQNVSITQWMFVCNCQAKELQSRLADDEPVRCQNCGKEKREKRAGTLTQWIFKSDVCTCEEEALGIKPNLNLIESLESTDAEREEVDEPALDVSASEFPVDRYKPIAAIGEGGSGSVYKCRDLNLNKLVAVKSLKAHTDEQLISFQKEAQALSRLSHPNIVSILDFGIVNQQTPYMVLDYFEGVSLRSYIDTNGPLPIESVTELFIGICSALEHAHNNQIFHRDLKPSNILIDFHGNVIKKILVIDFGVALLTQTKTDSGSNTIVGTPIYMSPDQISAKDYDERSEVYSLGVVLFEALTGMVPFKGETSLDTMSQHAHKNPPTLEAVAPRKRFTPDMENIVAKCLNKSPDNRFQSVEELKRALINASPYEPEKNEAKVDAKTKSYLVPILISLAVFSLGGLWLFNYQKRHAEELKSKSLSQSSPVVKQRRIRGKFERGTNLGRPVLKADENVTDEDIPRLLAMRFRSLDLSRSKITGENLDVLKEYNFVYLNLSFTKLTDKAFDAIKQLKQIKFLRFEGVPVNGNRMKAIAEMKQLTMLDVEQSKLTDQEMQEISVLKNLKSLDISGNELLTKKGFLQIKKLSNLNEIYICNSYIYNNDLRDICKSLKHLRNITIMNTFLIKPKEMKALRKEFPHLNVYSEKDLAGEGFKKSKFVKDMADFLNN